MRLNLIRRVPMILLCLLLGFGSITSASESINWRSYEEGLALGKIEKKKVFLHFYADWCGFCVKMAKDTFQNAEVIAYLNANFIPVMVNYDRELETAAKYGVQGLPLTMFLTAMGEPIIGLPGYIPPEILLSMLKEVNALGPGS